MSERSCSHGSFVDCSIPGEVNDNCGETCITDTYDIFEVIGKGCFGHVYRVIDKKSKEVFALKRVDRKIGRIPLYHDSEDLTNSMNSKNSVDFSEHPNEFCISLNLNSPFVVNLIQAFILETEMVYVMEFMAGGDLSTKVVEDGPVVETSAKFIIYQALEGVNYLHTNDVICRDLKLDNILLSNSSLFPITKLCDFGTSRWISDTIDTFCGTVAYMAPEISFHGEPYTTQVDLWSMGVVIFTTFTGTFPFKKRDRGKCYEKPIKFPRILRNMPLAMNLIDALLVQNPSERYTIEQALKNVWLAEERIRYSNLVSAESKSNIVNCT